MSERDERDRDSNDPEPQQYRLRIDPFTTLVERLHALELRFEDRVHRLELVVYGFCALILMGVVGAWIKLAGGK